MCKLSKGANMNIASISTAVRTNATFGAAKTDSLKEQIKELEGTAPDKVVDYGTWGDNYPVPITAGQKLETLQNELKRAAAEEAYQNPEEAEEPEWYKKQRFWSPEYVG